MRKKLLFIASLLVFSATSAQTVQLLNSAGNVVNGDTVTFTHYIDTALTQADFKHNEFVTVVNATTTDTMNIDLIREEIAFIPGSADYYCWGSQCLLARLAGTREVWQAFDPVETFPADSAGGVAPLQIYLSPRGNDGVSIFKYTFIDTDDRTGANSASVYVKWIILDTTVYADPVMLFNLKLRKFSLFGDSISRKTAFNTDTLSIQSVISNRASQDSLFEKEVVFNVFNATGGVMQLDMTREEIVTIPKSGDYFLWNGIATAETRAGVMPQVSANNPVTVQPRLVANKDFSIKLYLQADSVAGTAIYKYSFTDINDPSKTGSFIVKWTVDNITSINEIEYDNTFSIYPNPAETVTRVNFEDAMNYNQQEIQLFNIIGEQVLTEVLSKGTTTAEVNVESLTKGIYFMNIVANGVRLGSKKIIVK